MRTERPINAHIAIPGLRPDAYNEALALNRDVVGGVRYVLIETTRMKVLLPVESARELVARLCELIEDTPPQVVGEQD